MRRVVTLLSQVATTLDDNVGLRAQMDQSSKAAKRCQDDNLLLKQASLLRAHVYNFAFKNLSQTGTDTETRSEVWMPSKSIFFPYKQALLDEEKVMSAKNQQLRSEIEKLEKQVKAAEEGEQIWSGFKWVTVKWGR